MPITTGVGDGRATPNLFIVGAPKCGTTALARYLSQHPDVFVAGKELTYFGTDLVFRTKGGRWRIGYDAYLGWFDGHDTERYRTDRSVFYLYSALAAAEIQAYDPDSRVIALLRDPVDQMHSQHSEMLFQGEEDIDSFEDALAAEGDRRHGERVPAGCQKAFGLLYRDIASYAGQIERYYAALGRDHVCVVLYDDLRHDAAAAYRRVLEFLAVDPHHRPVFEVVNANKEVRSARTRDLLRRSPPGLRRVGRVLVPNQLRPCRAATPAAHHRTRAVGLAPPCPTRSATVCRDEFAPEVHRLEELLGRDLGQWLMSPGRPASQGQGR